MSDAEILNFESLRCMLQMVSAAINNSCPQLDKDVADWHRLYINAVDASLVNLVAYGIDKLPDEKKPCEKTTAHFDSERMKCVMKDANQLHQLDEAVSTCESCGIDNMPVKGSVLKYCYPQTDMRYMGDIDLLVHDCDINGVVKNIFDKNGYTPVNTQGEVHIEYQKPPFVTVELHRCLVPKNSNEYEYFQIIWSRAKLKNGSCHTFEPSPEDTYIYMNVHAVKHYIFGGLAPRILLDYYVFLEKYKDTLNFQYVEQILSDFGYLKFEKTLKELAYKWFAPNGTGLEKNELEIFIAGCGTYGRLENNVIMRVALQTKNGKNPSKLKFFASQLFPPIKAMTGAYPVLKDYPYLLPVTWVERLWGRVIKDKNVSFETGEYYKDISSSAVEKFRKLNNELGLNIKNTD